MKRNKMQRFILSALALTCLSACSSPPYSRLSPGPYEITAAELPGSRIPDTDFANAQIHFAAELFHRAAANSEGNILLSPLSVSLALSLCANGAAGNTLTEMEAVLGLPVSVMNEYLLTYTDSFPVSEECTLYSANSVWFRDDKNLLTVKDAFLRNADIYFGADIFSSPFDLSTVREINRWVQNKTEGMIDSLLHEIPQSAMLCLINALTFDAEWENTYTASDLYEGTFTAYDGTNQDADMMRSTESFYLESEDAVGFLRPYRGGRYSFAAVLPDEHMDIYDWIASLTPEKLTALLESAEETDVIACIPQFQAETTLDLNDYLKDMGISSALDPRSADFSSMAKTETGPLFISMVLHKTYLELDTDGTRAAAVTAVMMECGSAAPAQMPEVVLNRPFIFLVLDNETGIPVFMGMLVSLL